MQASSGTPNTPSTSVSVTYRTAEAVGDMNVVVVGWNDTTSVVKAVTDSAGNAYRLAIGPTPSTDLRQSIYYAPGIAGGSNTVTVTFSQAAVYPDIRILEYRGVNTLDATAGASGSGGTANSGSATTSSANELIVGAEMTDVMTGGAGSGFTSRVVSADENLAEDMTATSAGSYNATAAVAWGGWVMQMATFSYASAAISTRLRLRVAPHSPWARATCLLAT